MRATTTPTYTPVPIVMERAARNKARREAMLASGKSPLCTALVVWKRENTRQEESQIEIGVLKRKNPFLKRTKITEAVCYFCGGVKKKKNGIGGWAR